MRHVIASLLVALPVLAAAAPPKNFDAHVEAVMKASEVPGATIAIVENGKVTHARGYGIKRLDSPEAVDADTLFQIGSTTKAFTATALAILVEEGKIRWDDRVIDHLPDFRMYDPWVTREITVRDLLVHRSGLGRGQGDLMFVPSTEISRADLVRRIRYLKPATSFRSGFAYDNVLYAVAGQVIEAVSGKILGGFRRGAHPGARRHAGRGHQRRGPPVARESRLSARPHGRTARRRRTGALRREEGRARRERGAGGRDRLRRQRPRTLAARAARSRPGCRARTSASSPRRTPRKCGSPWCRCR